MRILHDMLITLSDLSYPSFLIVHVPLASLNGILLLCCNCALLGTHRAVQFGCNGLLHKLGWKGQQVCTSSYSFNDMKQSVLLSFLI